MILDPNTLPPASSFGSGTPNTSINTEGPVQGKSLKFSPMIVTEILLRVLRHCFSKAPEVYRWDSDKDKSNLAIIRANDLLDENVTQALPRITVSRNAFNISPSGLNQSMSSETPMDITKGIKDSRHMHFINGSFSIVIEAQTEGTVEILADMTASFLTWLSTHICSTYGLLTFGLPMSVGEPAPDKESTEKYKIVINSGFSSESKFRITEDAFKMLAVNLDTRVEAI